MSNLDDLIRDLETGKMHTTEAVDTKEIVLIDLRNATSILMSAIMRADKFLTDEQRKVVLKVGLSLALMVATMWDREGE